MQRFLLLILSISCSLTTTTSFTANRLKYNRKLSEFVGKTAWVRDLDSETVGAFSAAMCVDYASGELIEAVYDNPGIIRVNPTVSSTSVHTALSLVLPEVPYPVALVCDGNGVAFVAGSPLESSIVAVSLTSDGSGITRRSALTALPTACGGVLEMKYSSTLSLLVAMCGKDPASAIAIQVNRTDPELYVLTPGELKTVDGPNGVLPRGLAIKDDAVSSFAFVGLSEGTVVKLSLPDLEAVERRDVDAKRIAEFSIGDNGKTLVMFSPFPWRRILLMDISGDIATAEVTSVALDQDLEFVTDLIAEPSTSTAYVVGNSQRGLPAVMQFDITRPLDVWGIILAGMCSTEETCARRRSGGSSSAAQRRQAEERGAPPGSCRRAGSENSRRKGGGDDCDYVVWCEWGPKGRFARSMALDIHPERPGIMYIGVAAAYCEHCQGWEEDKGLFAPVGKGMNQNRARCKDGKQEEDYYDNDSYCLQEEWNTRTMAWSGGLTTAEMDQLSGKNWGGENVSVAIMQLGEIPKIGGVAAASTARPALWLTASCALALALPRLLP